MRDPSMVDWEVVDKRRAKGWDWDRVAEDPKVGFHADESAGDPGRALRALYYQRRSKAKRRSGDEFESGGGNDAGEVPRFSPIARAGYLLTPLVGVWFVLALAFPSLIGTFLTAIPWIGLILVVAAFLLAFGLLRSAERWNKTLRTTLVIGLVLGFVVAGGLGIAALAKGCPNLSQATTSEPVQGWTRAPNAAWSINGAPVFFFYGSAACPFCSASSWAMATALRAFGSLTGTYYDRSSLTDVAPGTSEIVLSSASLQSQWVAIHILETPDHDTISTPLTPECTDQAYVSTYDASSGIPFVVVNGQFIHTGTLVDPAQLRQTPGVASSPALSAPTIQGQIDNQSGTSWNAISGQTCFLEALIVHANHGNGPPAVTGSVQVQQCLAEIK